MSMCLPAPQAVRPGNTAFAFSDISPALRDAFHTSVFIGAPDEQAIRDVLAPWRKQFDLERLTGDRAEIDLPGGAMFLIALAIEQWGPPP